MPLSEKLKKVIGSGTIDNKNKNYIILVYQDLVSIKKLLFFSTVI